MKVKRLEYGFEDEELQDENWNSFKVYSIWSQPDIKITFDGVPIEYEDLEEKDSSEESKRLAVVVEFDVSKGGYLFIERPDPGPAWIKRIFELLKDEGWQGHSFKEIKTNCRDQIELETNEKWTAVKDTQSGSVYHNRDVSDGSGKIETIDKFERNQR